MVSGLMPEANDILYQIFGALHVKEEEQKNQTIRLEQEIKYKTKKMKECFDAFEHTKTAALQLLTGHGRDMNEGSINDHE